MKRDIKLKKRELIDMLKHGDSEKSQMIKKEIEDIEFEFATTEDKIQHLKLRNKKLQALQMVMQKNAESEFNEFVEKLDEIKRPVRKTQFIMDRMNREEMYFNPILNRLGQFRLVRQIKKARSARKSVFNMNEMNQNPSSPQQLNNSQINGAKSARLNNGSEFNIGNSMKSAVYNKLIESEKDQNL